MTAAELRRVADGALDEIASTADGLLERVAEGQRGRDGRSERTAGAVRVSRIDPRTPKVELRLGGADDVHAKTRI